MANTFRNLGFETASIIAGVADAWELVHLASNELFAEYGPNVPGAGLEAFELGWGNDAFVTSIEVTDPNAFAFYDTVPQDREDFEQEWDGNQFWSATLGSINEALYDSGTPQAFEDFEQEWSSNENFVFNFVGIGTDLAAASYDSATPQVVEDFEQEWSFNEVFQTTFSEFIGPITIFAIGDLIQRDDALSWITEQEFAHLLNGVGAVEIVSSVSNDGVHPITGISGGTDQNLVSSDALINDAAPTMTVRDFEITRYDAGVLIAEAYEGTWTAMATL